MSTSSVSPILNEPSRIASSRGILLRVVGLLTDHCGCSSHPQCRSEKDLGRSRRNGQILHDRIDSVPSFRRLVLEFDCNAVGVIHTFGRSSPRHDFARVDNKGKRECTSNSATPTSSLPLAPTATPNRTKRVSPDCCTQGSESMQGIRGKLCRIFHVGERRSYSTFPLRRDWFWLRAGMFLSLV